MIGTVEVEFCGEPSITLENVRNGSGGYDARSTDGARWVRPRRAPSCVAQSSSRETADSRESPDIGAS